MRSRGRLAAVAMVVAATRAGAQTRDARPADPEPRRAAALGVWTAAARDEPLRTRVGHTHNRDLYVVGVRGTWALTRGTALRVEYTADVLPGIVSTEMPTYATRPLAACSSCRSDTPTPEDLAGGRPVYGVGALPVGLQLRAAVAPHLSLLARGAAGAVWFERRVPDPAERRLNFWGDLGAGAELTLARAMTLGVGYRLNHISNANTGPVNPGMNSRMLELGVSWQR